MLRRAKDTWLVIKIPNETNKFKHKKQVALPCTPEAVAGNRVAIVGLTIRVKFTYPFFVRGKQ
jgi:hypothetical protein